MRIMKKLLTMLLGLSLCAASLRAAVPVQAAETDQTAEGIFTKLVKEAYDEEVLVKDAYLEWIEVKPEYDEYISEDTRGLVYMCCQCDAIFYSACDIDAHLDYQAEQFWNGSISKPCASYQATWDIIPAGTTVRHEASYEYIEHPAVYKTVHHDAEYKDIPVTVSFDTASAYTKPVVNIADFITVTANGETLVPDIEYELSYSKNIQSDYECVIVTVNGISPYSGNVTIECAVEHVYDDVQIVTEPGCETKGLAKYTCSCGASYTEEIPAAGHAYDEKGKCTKCGKFIFEDVPETSKKTIGYISWAYENKIVVGTGNSTFSPEDPCKRIDFIMMLWKMHGMPKASAANPFSDVTASKKTRAIQWALEKGIVVPGEKFNADDPISRMNVVMILWKMTGSPENNGDNPFGDVNGAKSNKAVTWAYDEKITKGTSSETFSPNANCTRAQLVTLLYKYNLKYDVI